MLPFLDQREVTCPVTIYRKESHKELISFTNIRLMKGDTDIETGVCVWAAFCLACMYGWGGPYIHGECVAMVGCCLTSLDGNARYFSLVMLFEHS